MLTARLVFVDLQAQRIGFRVYFQTRRPLDMTTDGTTSRSTPPKTLLDHFKASTSSRLPDKKRG